MGASRIAALTTAVLLAGMLSGCQGSEDEAEGPDPEEAVAALVGGLESGDLSAVPFTDATDRAAARSFERTVEGLGEAEPSLEVIDVVESDGAATATLGWYWPLGAQQWDYRSQAELELVEGEWRVVWDPTIVESSLAKRDVLDASTIAAERGAILGAGGLALVTERPVVRFGIDRSQVAEARAGESARRLAELVGVDTAPYVKAVEAAGDAAFVEAIVFRRDEVPPDVLDGYDRIAGGLAVAGELPLAPTREFAAPILGTVGEVTAEMIEEDPDRYSIGDRAGLSGLQARYEEQLAGTPGVLVEAVTPEGEERELFRVEPVKGEPLRLTLDTDLQLAAERLLAGVGPASALVALRPSDGEILVAANGPGTDGYNMATFGQFAPGSTFKAVSSLALLRAGLTPSSSVPCTSSVVVDGKRFENYDDYPSGGLGRIPLRTAVANSCNTAFISQADRLRDDDLADAAASLGLGVDHDLGFPAYFGQVVPPESATQKAADMIGQGKVLASPMAMAAVAASVQSGTTVLPRLVRDWEQEQESVPALGRSEAAAVREMLRAVVTAGSGSLLADVPGPPVIAKTGTAEFERDGRLQTHAWMIAAQGDLAVAVFVEVGASGSGTAGPILEAFLRAAR
jgi:hypothetical protein